MKEKDVMNRVKKYNSNYWTFKERVRGHRIPLTGYCKTCGKAKTLHAFSWEHKTVVCKHGVTKTSKHRKATYKQGVKGHNDLISNQINKVITAPWNSLTYLNNASYGEQWLETFLIDMELPYEKQKTFPDLKSPKGWPLRYDFLVADYVLLEYDGNQHYEYDNFFDKTLNNHQYRQYCDQYKEAYAKKQGMPLYRFTTKNPNELNQQLCISLLKHIN